MTPSHDLRGMKRKENFIGTLFSLILCFLLQNQDRFGEMDVNHDSNGKVLRMGHGIHAINRARREGAVGLNA